MKNLREYVNELLTFIKKDGNIPKYNNTFIYEIRKNILNDENKKIIYKKNLYKIENYEKSFLSLFYKGYSWINMNCAGILDGDLIIIIELPNKTTGITGEAVSVNFSGPMLKFPSLDRKWDMRQNYSIIDR